MLQIPWYRSSFFKLMLIFTLSFPCLSIFIFIHRKHTLQHAVAPALDSRRGVSSDWQYLEIQQDIALAPFFFFWHSCHLQTCHLQSVEMSPAAKYKHEQFTFTSQLWDSIMRYFRALILPFGLQSKADCTSQTTSSRLFTLKLHSEIFDPKKTESRFQVSQYQILTWKPEKLFCCVIPYSVRSVCCCCCCWVFSMNYG